MLRRTLLATLLLALLLGWGLDSPSMGQVRPPEPTIVSPVLSVDSPGDWWEENRREWLGNVVEDRPGGLLTREDSSRVEGPVDPFRISDAMHAIGEEPLPAEWVPLLQEARPSKGLVLSRTPYMAEFYALSANADVHRALKLEEVFADERGRLPSDYERLQPFLRSTATPVVVATFIDTAPREDESEASYMRRAMANTPELDDDLHDALRGLPGVASALAAMCWQFARDLAEADNRFGMARLPTTTRELRDLIYLLSREIIGWRPSAVSAETTPGELRQVVENRLVAWLGEARDDGELDDDAWDDLYTALTTGLPVEDVNAVCIWLATILDETTRAALRHDPAYREAYPLLAAKASIVRVLSGAKAASFRDDAVTVGGVGGSGRRITRAQRLQPSLENAAVEMLMIMRYINEQNADRIRRYRFASNPSEAAEDYRERDLNGQYRKIRAEAKAVLGELLAHARGKVAPLIETSVADEAYAEENDRRRADDLAGTTYWASIASEWATSRDYVEDLEEMLEASKPRLSLASDEVRRDGAVKPLRALPAPVIPADERGDDGNGNGNGDGGSE